MAVRRAEDVVAAVNGAVVLLVPVAITIAFMLKEPGMDAPVRPPGNYVLNDFFAGVMSLEVPLAPFAVVAGWRTWVRVRRWRTSGRRDCWGVLEGGMAGFAAAVVVLIPGILRRPLDALPYIIVYGGLGIGVGLAFGALLQCTGMLTLALYERCEPIEG